MALTVDKDLFPEYRLLELCERFISGLVKMLLIKSIYKELNNYSF